MVRVHAAERARVPWQCKSAKGKSVLIVLLIGGNEKGQRVNIPVLFD